MKTETAYGYNKSGDLVPLKYKPKTQEGSGNIVQGIVKASLCPAVGFLLGGPIGFAVGLGVDAVVMGISAIFRAIVPPHKGGYHYDPAAHQKQLNKHRAAADADRWS